MSVAIPTLNAGELLSECLQSLTAQRFRDFEIIVIDNSGQALVRRIAALPSNTRLIENPHNAGYGAAINQAIRQTASAYVAVLNDDAVADPDWLQAMVATMDRHPTAGMCACRVMLKGSGVIDSAGMLLCADGSSKQRGRGAPSSAFSHEEEVLCPSGSAAMYRRAMLEETGGFEDDFFLYCEDTDLGLRAQWAGWRCIYTPTAVVHHHYSASAGRVSPLKAYLVERNRLCLLVRNFPLRMLAGAPAAAIARYFWHATLDHGAAAGFRREGNSSLTLGWFVLRAHFAALIRLPRLWRQRRKILCSAKISAADFRRLAQSHRISPREVAKG
ncbi:MAG: glycosyltransferase family 2 protein [Bryobacteraceae bacterium]|nr:glycosyltransferase family 2 protein [Bryobacteraceae bacterium]